MNPKKLNRYISASSVKANQKSDRSSDTMLLFFMKHMASVLVRNVFRILVLLECRLVSKPGVNERNLYLNIIYGQEKLHNKLSGDRKSVV